MNATLLAQQAYSRPDIPIRTNRSVEYDVIAKITADVSKAHNDQGPGAFANLSAALHRNRMLWTILAADVAEPGNELPEMLRAQIFYLAEFTDIETSAILAGKTDAAGLIDINTAVMRGLRGQTGGVS